MKKFSLLLLTVISLNVQAQKTLEKEIAYGQQIIAADLTFASAIEVKTWNKPAIKIEASIETEDKKYTEMYELEVKSNGATIEISSNAKDLFEAYREEHSSRYSDLKHEFNYTLFVPEDVKLEVTSVTGSVFSEFLQGDIHIDLVTGNADIENFKGHLDLKSVTGKINLPVKDSSYSAKTVMGTIHGNSDPEAEKKIKFIGEEINRYLKDSRNRLILNTVTGDIYLN